MGTPVWQILAKLDRIHELQAQTTANGQSSLFAFGGSNEDPVDQSFDDEISQDPLNDHRENMQDFAAASTTDGVQPALRNRASSSAQILATTATGERKMGIQRVPVNVYEASGALMVVAPIPAVMADDVTIELRRGSLEFRAALRSAAPRSYLVHEWDCSGFEGVVELPDGFGSTADASLANGQLVIRVLRGQCTGPVTVHPGTPRPTASTGSK